MALQQADVYFSGPSPGCQNHGGRSLLINIRYLLSIANNNQATPSRAIRTTLIGRFPDVFRQLSAPSGQPVYQAKTYRHPPCFAPAI